jgi:glucokinase
MSATVTIGADLGGTKMLVGVVDDDQQVHFRTQEHSRGQTEDELIEMLGREVDEARCAFPGVAAAGIGVPCTMDFERGIAIGAVNLPISNVPIRDLVSERVGLPVFVDNDANLAVLAEHRHGAARGARNVVMITVGTGIGGGLVIDGQIYRGTTGAGAELGHVILELDGPRCQGSCPGFGHAETLASGTALGVEGRRAAERHPDSALGKLVEQGVEIDGKAVTTAALSGDRPAKEVVTDIGRRIGATLSGFANIFEPEVMVVGGGVAAAGDLLLEPARREVAARALPPMNATPVVAAALGSDAGMIGGATLARIEVERQG